MLLCFVTFICVSPPIQDKMFSGELAIQSFSTKALCVRPDESCLQISGLCVIAKVECVIAACSDVLLKTGALGEIKWKNQNM